MGCGAERPQQLHDLGADMAVADQADRQVAQFLSGKVGAVKVAAPLTFGERRVPFGDEAGLCQNHADGEFGHCAGVAARCIDHRDIAASRRLHVDVDRPAGAAAMSLRAGSLSEASDR